jgi:murein DD-endopeptidase MepM/ murein hydrolase activator NlpD
MQNLRVLAVSVLISVIVVLGAGAASGAAPAGRGSASTATAAESWQWPLAEPHPLTRPFENPLTRYAPGHRGIDLATKTHSAVLAPHDGVVSFAGRVADRPVLSIMQEGDVITTMEPVDALVAVGDRVRAGQMIGTVASGGHCPPDCLHLGVRVRGLYVSPLLFLGDVPRAVLLPSLP